MRTTRKMWPVRFRRPFVCWAAGRRARVIVGFEVIGWAVISRTLRGSCVC